jgi:hypothetical protein
MLSDWVSFLAYPNLFGIKDFVVVVVVVVVCNSAAKDYNVLLLDKRYTFDHPSIRLPLFLPLA